MQLLLHRILKRMNAMHQSCLARLRPIGQWIASNSGWVTPSSLGLGAWGVSEYLLAMVCFVLAGVVLAIRLGYRCEKRRQLLVLLTLIGAILLCWAVNVQRDTDPLSKTYAKWKLHHLKDGDLSPREPLKSLTPQEQVDAQIQKEQEYLAEHTLVFVAPGPPPIPGSNNWRFVVLHLGDVKPAHNVQVFGSNYENGLRPYSVLPAFNENPEPGVLKQFHIFQMRLTPKAIHHLYFKISDEDTTFIQELCIKPETGVPDVASRVRDMRTGAFVLTCKDSRIDKFLDDSWRKDDMPECVIGLFRVNSVIPQ